MKTPTSAKSTSGLRGDYEAAAADYSVSQEWGSYTPAMHERWQRLHARQIVLAQRYAAPQFLAGLAHLNCAHGIPRFEQADLILGNATGWSLVAVPGYIPDDCFFNHLANRRFPVTRWLREEHELDYLVEPDVFHDFFGHVPMLLDPAIAEFLAAYGRLGSIKAKGATDMLARLYWYTIEFGLIDVGGGLKAFGAGIISSAGETVYSVEDRGVLRLRFDPARILRTGYSIDCYQRCYFVLDSLDQLIGSLGELDFGPVFEARRSRPPLPAGKVHSRDRLWCAASRAEEAVSQ
jgi:phenylalanine-4-hydroxylase